MDDDLVLILFFVYNLEQLLSASLRTYYTTTLLLLYQLSELGILMMVHTLHT